MKQEGKQEKSVMEKFDSSLDIQSLINKEITADGNYVGKIISFCKESVPDFVKISSMLDFMMNHSISENDDKTNLNSYVTELKNILEDPKNKKPMDRNEMTNTLKTRELIESISDILEAHRKNTKELKFSVLDIITSESQPNKKIEHIKVAITKYMLNQKFI